MNNTGYWATQYRPFYNSRHLRGNSHRVILAQRSMTRIVGRGKRRSQNKKWWIATCQKLRAGNEQELHAFKKEKSLSLPLLPHIIFAFKNQSSQFHSGIGQHGNPKEDECARWTNSTLPLKHNDDCCQRLQNNTQQRYTCMHACAYTSLALIYPHARMCLAVVNQCCRTHFLFGYVLWIKIAYHCESKDNGREVKIGSHIFRPTLDNSVDQINQGRNDSQQAQYLKKGREGGDDQCHTKQWSGVQYIHGCSCTRQSGRMFAVDIHLVIVSANTLPFWLQSQVHRIFR